MSSASTTNSLYQAPKLSAFLMLMPSFVFFFSSPVQASPGAHSSISLHVINEVIAAGKLK
jgi:hypothetical protein